jgi:hypothetical protein
VKRDGLAERVTPVMDVGVIVLVPVRSSVTLLETIFSLLEIVVKPSCRNVVKYVYVVR